MDAAKSWVRGTKNPTEEDNPRYVGEAYDVVYDVAYGL